MSTAGETEKLQRCVSGALARFAREPGPLLEILHAVQDELGCVPADAVPLIADGLNISRAEVHGVVSFYHHFREQAPGRYLVQLCRAEACQSMNARALEEFVRARLHIGFGETTPDGAFTLKEAECLGACGEAPVLLVNNKRMACAMSPDKLDKLIGEFK